MEATGTKFAPAGSALSGETAQPGSSPFLPHLTGEGWPDALIEATLKLPRSTQAPRLARQCVKSQSGEQLGRSEREIVEVLVTELVNNAVMHAGPEGGESVKVHFAVTPDRVCVVVRDYGEGFGAAELRRPRTEPGGYGLIMVERGSSRWGTAREDGNCVWFEIDRN